MVLTALARCFGFLRETFAGGILGTSYIADAFNVAISVPNILFANIGAAIGTTFIPLYIGAREKGAQKSLDFANRVFMLVLWLGLLISILSAVFARPLLSVIAFGFNEQTMEIAVRIGRVIFFMAVFMGINAVLTGYLQANNKFLMTAAISMPYNIVLILSLIMYGHIGIQGVAAAALAGMCLEALFLFFNAFSSGFRCKPTLRMKDKDINDMLLLAMPVFLGSSVSQINTLIDRMLASGLAEGSISALNYAYKLVTFVFGITVAVIGVIIYPLLSEFTASKNATAFKNLTTRSFNAATLILLPVTAAACMLNTDVVRMLFERGAFDARSTAITASALFFYAFGIVFMGYRDILSRCFYALQDTKTPMVNGAVALGINVLLNLILVRHMGHNGLALATSVSAAVSTALLTRSLRRKMGGVGGGKILVTFIKSSVSVAVMGVAVFFLRRILKSAFSGGGILADILTFGLLAAAGVCVYAVCLYVLKTEEVRQILDKGLRFKTGRPGGGNG